MKFTVVKKIYPNGVKAHRKTIARIGGKETPVFSVNISEGLLRRAKMVIGDRVTLAYVKDDRQDKWLLIESDPSGYKLLSTRSTRKGAKCRDGEYGRALFKTTHIEEFMLDEFTEPSEYEDRDADVDTGYIALPFPKKKGLFG